MWAKRACYVVITAVMDMRWVHPFAVILAGPRKSGESYFVSRFLKHVDRMCAVEFGRALFYYSEWQAFYRGLSGLVEFRGELPQAEDYSYDNEKAKLVILDDLRCESSGTVVLDLLSRGSHHKNLSVYFYYAKSHPKSPKLQHNVLVFP